jgi:hypothetical protein
MGQVYQRWWRICREINVFPGSNITCFTFYIHLCPFSDSRTILCSELMKASLNKQQIRGIFAIFVREALHDLRWQVPQFFLGEGQDKTQTFHLTTLSLAQTIWRQMMRCGRKLSWTI